MADCFSLQSIKEYVEDLRAIEAYGEMFVSPYEAGNYADTIEQLMQKVAEDDAVIERIRKKAEDEIEALLAENAKLKAERDDALKRLAFISAAVGLEVVKEEEDGAD